jgi:hypothetical protein
VSRLVRISAALAVTLAATLAITLAVALAGAAPAAAVGEATWSSQQPTPPGVPWPVALGKVGDVEFFKENRGLLTTEGSEPTVAKGVWAYNGVEWHPLATVCGATAGRIAWAGPDEFWTVSDGRPGQAPVVVGGVERTPPLIDNTLCHFAGGEVVGSYAHPAFEPDSYLPMHGAACISASDCWFGGDALEEPQIGSFHLHWNGATLELEPDSGEGHPVEDMRALEGHVYETVRVTSSDRVAIETAQAPVVHRINPPGVTPTFEAEDEEGRGLPLYESNELPRALDYLHLSAAAGALWAAGGRKYHEEREPGHAPGQVTVAIREAGSWRQVIGPEHPLGPIFPPEEAAEEEQFPHPEPGERGSAANAEVTAIAAEPGGETAWVGLAGDAASTSSRAVLVHVSAEGQLLGEQTLPSAQEEREGIGPKGAVAQIACPGAEDCWMVTTQGWLFHLSTPSGRTLPRDEDPNFAGPISHRPPDQGLPQLPADAPPADTSGLVEVSEPPHGSVTESFQPKPETRVTLPLLAHVRSRIVKGSTLELSFHLAVKARVRLVAQRGRAVIAATPTRTFKAGRRSLLLKLDRHRWPTKLKLLTHALAPLPIVSSVSGEGANVTTESTPLSRLPGRLPALLPGLLP